jgi:hypothetical protein
LLKPRNDSCKENKNLRKKSKRRIRKSMSSSMITKLSPKLLSMKSRSSTMKRKRDSRRDQSMKSRDMIRNSIKPSRTTKKRSQRLTITTRTHISLSRMRKIKLRIAFKINSFNCKKTNKS